jgi:hypothetical protein
MLHANFAVLRQILLDLGFTIHVEPGAFVRFDRADADTWFVFRPHQDNEAVNLPNLRAVQRVLDEKGVLPSKQFEELLHQRVIAG